jgi:hypothetical protein
LILSVSFVSVACASILGNDFEVMPDAARMVTAEAGGDRMDHGDAPVAESDHATDASVMTDASVVADAPSENPAADVELYADVSPTSDHLVINEIDYDQPGADTAEFVEIYNGTGAPVSLASMALVLVNGSINQEYMNLALSAAGTLASGQYLVVCAELVNVDPAAIKLLGFTTNGIQNGAPDGVALVDTANHRIVDALSYAGSITATTVTGVNGSVNLVEGSPLSIADSATANGALIRKPNGRDTDDASADWSFSATPSPGAANSFP